MTGQDALHGGNGISDSYRADVLADNSRSSGWSRWCTNPINKVCRVIIALPVPSFGHCVGGQNLTKRPLIIRWWYYKSHCLLLQINTFHLFVALTIRSDSRHPVSLGWLFHRALTRTAKLDSLPFAGRHKLSVEEIPWPHLLLCGPSVTTANLR